MKIAVCIPVYNRQATIDAAIQSVIEQKVSCVDLHIFDNASTDNTAKICVARQGPKVYYHRHETNIGYVGNINSCLGLATNYDWIGILHSDDRYLQGALPHVEQALAANAEAGLVFSKVDLMDEAGVIYRKAHSCHETFKAGREAVERSLHHLPCSSTFYSSNAIRKTGYYNPYFKYSADEEYGSRIASQFSIVELAFTVAAYRKHRNNLMTRTWLEADFIENFEAMRIEMTMLAEGNKERAKRRTQNQLAHLFIHCGYELGIGGHRHAALKYFQYTAKYRRSDLLNIKTLAKITLALLPILGPGIAKLRTFLAQIGDSNG